MIELTIYRFIFKLGVIGKCYFEVGQNAIVKSPRIMKFKDFILSDHMPYDRVSPYLFDSTFDFDTDLDKDYFVPAIFSSNDLLSLLPLHIRPDFRWFLVGKDLTGSVLHIDPYKSSAWNALVVGGQKDWIIISPIRHMRERLSHNHPDIEEIFLSDVNLSHSPFYPLDPGISICHSMQDQLSYLGS